MSPVMWIREKSVYLVIISVLLAVVLLTYYSGCMCYCIGGKLLICYIFLELD